MSESLRLFLAQSFAVQKTNANGDEDANGVSDKQIADLVAEWIVEFSGGRIAVIRTRDPHRDYISSAVRRDICSSDVVLCLFTRRTKDHVKQLWLPSTYVVSEASAALMQFPSEEATHGRLFGLVEEGVDPEQLGMAFHRNKAADGFRRDDLTSMRLKVKGIVDTIQQTKLPAREEREYLALQKVVSIWRNGSVTVECRHRFRFTAQVSTVRIPHSMWRISDALPNIPVLRRGSTSSQSGFLRCVPLDCGHRGQKACRCRIIPAKSGDPQEHSFDVEFSDLSIAPGDELTYEIAWGYRNAFHDPSQLNGMPNSVGLRTGDRGMAHSASLTLKFQRDLDDDDGEPHRILEEHPQVFLVDTPLIPSGRDRADFWHRSRTWRHVDSLEPCQKLSGAIFEVYRWKRECFNGMAKVIWTPYHNYFQDDDPKSAPNEEATPIFKAS